MSTDFICQYCNKQFSTIQGLHRHVNTSHLHTTTIVSKIVCPICKENISKCIFISHLMTQHRKTKLEATIMSEIANKKKFNANIPDDIISAYMQLLNKNSNQIKYYERQFNSFYRLINLIEPFELSHIQLFVDKVLPWKLKHPNASNNRALPDLIYSNDKQKADKLYQLSMLDKNPFYQHDGTISVFSMDYKGYAGLSDEEKKERIYKIAKHDMPGRNINQKEYWMKRGYSEEDAIAEAKKHINVFSLEKCIERHGKEEGTRIFNERQKKWQATLKSKPIEEQRRINHLKTYRKGSTSTVEHEFLSAISKDENVHNVYVREAHAIVDMLVGDRIIEFYGDYWHCNPVDIRFGNKEFYNSYTHRTAEQTWQHDLDRVNRLVKLGYTVKVVWESDYKKNKDKTISDCKRFIDERSSK